MKSCVKETEFFCVLGPWFCAYGVSVVFPQIQVRIFLNVENLGFQRAPNLQLKSIIAKKERSLQQ